MSVTAALMLVKTGAHDGLVDGHTRTSPGCSLVMSLSILRTRAGPSTTPAEDAKPLISETSAPAVASTPLSHSLTLSVVIPHSIMVNGSATSSGGTPRAG